MRISGLDIPQADRLERVVERVRAATRGEPFAAGSTRDESYYRRAATLLGWLSAQGTPTEAGEQLVALDEESAIVRAAVDFERSTVGRAWLAFEGVSCLEEIQSPDAVSFLRATSSLAPTTIARRAVTLRQWIERSQAALRDAPNLARTFRADGGERGDDPVAVFLASNLDQRLPTRMANWAAAHGVRTYGELAAIDARDLRKERNLGRRSIAVTDDLFRASTGLSWSELHEVARLDGAPPGEPSATPPAPTTWNELRGVAPDWLRQIQFRHLDLPTRMLNFCERQGLTSIGALLEWSAEALSAEKNLGRRSIRQTLEALQKLWQERATSGVSGAPSLQGTEDSASSTPRAPSIELDGPWLRLVRESIRELSAIDRMVITRRLGLHGDRATLQELGEILGVSRERARQIEARVLERLSSSWWADALREQLSQRCAENPVELERLAEDETWTDVDTHADLFDSLCERVLRSPFRVVELAGRAVVAQCTRRQLDELRAELGRDLRALAFPVPIELVRGIVGRHGGAWKLDALLWEEVESDLVLGDGVALGFGGRRNEELLAFLRGSPEPVPVRELEPRFGRGRLPDEVIYVERGVVGLPSHVPDFELWTRRLVPLCVATMLQDDPSRQWSVVELLDQLAERVQLPEWLGHWHLASMIRVDGTLRYLGRLRVALDHRDAPEERAHLRDVALEALRSAGAPMRKDLLYASLTESAACSELAFTSMVLRAPFVPLDDERIGLIERDLPGGAEAAAEAVEALESELEERGVGLAPAEVLEVVQELEGPHGSWTIEMVRSIARDAGSLRVNRSGSIGLAEWDDEQIPTRRELVRELVRAHDGRVAVEVVQAALETRFGGRVTRATLYNLAQASGAQLRGDEVVDLAIAVASTPPPTELPDPLSLPGFPRAAVEPFARGLDLELDPDELAAAVERHLAELEDAHRSNEFLDPHEARAVAASCRRFLERARATTGPTRTLALAAVRYFILTDDAESDFEVGGLDDDMGVLDAIATHLGWLDCRVAR